MFAALAAFDLPACAQGTRAGDGSIRIDYQYTYTDQFLDDTFTFDNWETKSHVLLLSGNYAITDRWSVYGTLPYVQKRFIPGELFNGAPHNPNDPWWINFEPPDKRFIDDGDYHGGLQDLTVGAMYHAFEGPRLSISPFAGYGTPMTDYPFYGKAAIGQNLWTLPVGASFSYVPYFSDWYLRGNLAYVFSEKPLDVNVDYWLGQLALGYWFRPDFSASVFLNYKWVRDGLRLPGDYPSYFTFPQGFDTPEWWQHDRLIAHRNIVAGLGVDYAFGGRYKLSSTFFSSVFTEQSSSVGYAFSLGLTRYFSKR